MLINIYLFDYQYITNIKSWIFISSQHIFMVKMMICLN